MVSFVQISSPYTAKLWIKPASIRKLWRLVNGLRFSWTGSDSASTSSNFSSPSLYFSFLQFTVFFLLSPRHIFKSRCTFKNIPEAEKMLEIKHQKSLPVLPVHAQHSCPQPQPACLRGRTSVTGDRHTDVYLSIYIYIRTQTLTEV